MRLEAANWFVRLQEHPGDEALADAFDYWLDADARHVVAWAKIADTAQAIADSKSTLQDTWHIASNNAAASLPAPTIRRGGRRSGRPHQWAATALAAACVAWFAGPSLLLHAQADHMTAAGETRVLAMEDGSTIRLGPDSAIVASFDKEHRDIRLLSGQAWFEVRPDRTRPFRVKARGVTTTVLGTGFDIRMIGTATSVAVRHGRVRVEAPGRPGAQVRELIAGQWATVIGGGRMQTGSEQPELIGAWQNGEILARRRTIGDAIAELRPWFGGRIIITDDSLARRPISGVYHVDDPAKALVSMVHPYGGHITRFTPWLLIVSGS